MPVKPIRIGIVGAGNMGAAHARTLLEGRVPGLELVAMANRGADRLAPFPQVAHFSGARELIAARCVDALLVATPHTDHLPSALAALRAGLHVLVEKPLAVHAGEARRLARAAAVRPRQVFAAMFNLRTDRRFQRVRELVHAGELGPVRRVNWILTNWYRTQAYYDSADWRGTWAGEGGGVLLNQCPHNLDLLQWIVGMPVRVRAFCGFGRFHDIEVEDDVTAYLEFPGGATGVFVTSTGETPGSNRLEITGDRGRILLEGDRLSWARNATPMGEFSRTATGPFARPAVVEEELRVDEPGGGHAEVLQNFADVIRRRKTPLIAPGAEGVRSIELANAMLLSAWTGETVRLPLNASRYARLLAERRAASRPRRRPAGPRGVADLAASFAR